MIVTIIGLGLIGGSIAKDLRKNGFAKFIYGVDNNVTHQKQALELGIVDKVCSLEDSIPHSDLSIFAIPVDGIIQILPKALDLVEKNGTITDVGSTKLKVVECVKNHPNRRNFVASHPMSGTENSGPSAALESLFKNKVCIICDRELSGEKHVEQVRAMYNALEGKIVYMSSDDHDHNTAYISHLPHVTAFALANSVLNKEDRQVIVELAGGGFRDAARLAKSSPEMWTSVFKNNKEYLLAAIEEYSKHLAQMKKDIAEDNWNKVYDSIKNSNKLREFLSK